MKLDNAVLYADSNRGQYIPQFFAESIKSECVKEYTKYHDSLENLKLGPYTDDYYEAWEDVLDNVTVYDEETGITYGLYQDGDLWLVPIEDMLVEDEDVFFLW